jgi:hypothetical protein
LNPLLSALPAASADLIRQAEFRDTYEGRVVPRESPCCGLARDTILIRETASTYTLLHEFVQSRLVPLDRPRPDDDIELRFALDFNRLKVYMRRLYADQRKLLDPLWRHDILAAQSAVADRLFQRIQFGQSQEVIVEKVLCCFIDERSPYFDTARRVQGVRYRQGMIDNAVEVFDTVHDAVKFVEDSIGTLHAEAGAGRIEPGRHPRLSDSDLQSALASIRAIEASLSRVSAELLALKEFHAR